MMATQNQTTLNIHQDVMVIAATDEHFARKPSKGNDTDKTLLDMDLEANVSLTTYVSMYSY